MTWSFEKNPESGGMPAIAAAETVHVSAVTGIGFQSPPIFIRSISSFGSPCITEPAPRNRHALKNAWVTSRKMAAP